jgi:hypothetical protein
VRIFCTLLAFLLLAGCSTVRLVYENAETYIRWRATDYLEVEGESADQLDEAIGAFMSWHRANALPKYTVILGDAERRFARGLGQADLDWGYDAVMTQARESLRVGAEKIAPLLDRLTPAQIAHLERQLADDNRKFARENLRGGERERRQRRTERNVERLEDWVGRLSQAQIDRVAQYSARAPLLDEMRDRDHRRLQGELLRIIRAREARTRLPQFAVAYDRGRDPAYGAALEASRKEYFAMALDIDKTLSAKQRERAQRKLRGYADDFRELARPPS